MQLANTGNTLIINDMYIRKVKTTNKNTGKEYFTYRLVKNIRENGMPKQINLVSLGKLEDVKDDQLKLLAKGIEELYHHKLPIFSLDLPENIQALAHFFSQKLVQKEFVNKPNQDSDNQDEPQIKQFVEIDINSTDGKSAEQIGGEFLCSQAIDELGLEIFLKEKIKYTPSQIDNSMLALIGRLLHPSSENQTAKWLNDNSAAQEFHPLESGKVNKNQLYSASNQLYKNKKEIEQFLGKRIKKIFSINRKIVLYDLTNTHFEGQMKNSDKADFGRNKQKRNDCRQITLGLLVDENGFPANSKYYKGNIGEPGTLEGVIKDLSEFDNHLFSKQKPCIIMDAGIATDENVKLLLKNNYEYICVSRSGHKDLINNVNDDQIVKFKNKSNQELSAQLFKQKFEYQDAEDNPCSIEESLIYIKSPEKEKKEYAINEKKILRFEQGLKDICKTINNLRGQRSLSKIHQRLGRLKEKNKGVTGNFDIQLKDDSVNVTSLTWQRKSNTPKEKKQGVYFLRSNISDNDEEKLWKTYRLINEVEDAFATLKSELNVRPNFHHSDATIEAHINLCVLAYYIVNFIRFRLKSKGITLCWSEIRRIMSTQKRCLLVSRTRTEKALWTKYCTRPIPQADKIYQVMGYKKMPFYRKNLIV